MKTTGNRHAGADGPDYAPRPHTTGGERGSRVSAGTGIRPAVAAMGAAALLAVLGTLPPAAHAASCTALQRGTLSGNTFTPSSTGSDYYTVCTGDTGGQGVYEGHLRSSMSQSGAAYVDPNDGNARLVVNLGNAFIDTYLDEFPVDDGAGNRIFRGGIVVLGTAGGASDWNEGIDIEVGEIDRYGDLNIDSHATISTTGGARGIQVEVNGNTPSSGRLRLRNFGSVETTGGGATHDNRRGYAITGSSRDGVAEVVNESGASVTARGPGGRGIIAGTDGSAAIATNRGTVTTHGDPVGDRRAYGVAAFANWFGTNDGSGSASATNDVGGTVTTHGDGARGVSAYSGWNGIQGGTAVATNRGTVTTRGNTDSRRTAADGVYANSNGGTARATNEAGATIRTYGTGARGVGADNSHGSVSGRAEVENRGTISTSGQYANTGAHGMSAWSEHNSATAVNHAGATVTTSGRGANGVQASAGGGPDDTALAFNRGTVTTTGDTFHDESRVSATVGVVAYGVRGGEASAVVENAYEGVVDVSGTGAKGVWAVAWSGYGDATARNHGRITTRGDAHRVDRTGTDNDTYRSPNALQATSRYSDATVVNEIGGVIETHGTVGHGLDAYAGGGGSAVAVNRGRVTTRGESADDLPGDVGRTLGARGITVYSRHGRALAGNDSTGRVDTHGKRAFGVFAESDADGSRTSGTVEVVNRGQVHTRGWNADGVTAIALHPGTADNPNHARATNTTGASVTTEGSGAGGLTAGVFVPAWTAGDPVPDGVVCTTSIPPDCPTVAPAASTATARNHGTVVTGVVEAADATGDDVSMDAGTYASNGVVAAFFGSPDTTITSAGDVTVINTGDVTVKRVNATGLYAETFGSGDGHRADDGRERQRRGRRRPRAVGAHRRRRDGRCDHRRKRRDCRRLDRGHRGAVPGRHHERAAARQPARRPGGVRHRDRHVHGARLAGDRHHRLRHRQRHAQRARRHLARGRGEQPRDADQARLGQPGDARRCKLLLGRERGGGERRTGVHRAVRPRHDGHDAHPRRGAPDRGARRHRRAAANHRRGRHHLRRRRGAVRAGLAGHRRDERVDVPGSAHHRDRESHRERHHGDGAYGAGGASHRTGAFDGGRRRTHSAGGRSDQHVGGRW